MSKLTTVADLRKGQTFLDLWGNEWTKVSSKKDRMCLATRNNVEFEFQGNFSCFTCSREDALEDIKDRLDMAGNLDYWAYRLKAMTQDPYMFIRDELARLSGRSGMVYNGRSFDVEEGIRRLLTTLPPTP